MPSKPPVLRPPRPRRQPQTDHRRWHNGSDIEMSLFARSLDKAARALLEKLKPDAGPKAEWDACPIILLYRQGLELRLKALVDAGNNFLPSPTDSITLRKTRSLRWLAQIVCQIIKAVEWEDVFRCEGVSSLADFAALVNEIESLDPVSCIVHSPSRGRNFSAPPRLQPAVVNRFIGQVEALLALLDATADGLSATWDLRMAGMSEEEIRSAIRSGGTVH
jgi:hypothetical protein